MSKTIKILRIALDANPQSWETRRHLAELLFEEGQGAEAQDLLAAAPEVPQTDEDELFAAEHLLDGHPAQAASFVDRTLRRNKGSAKAHWLKAQVFQALGLMEDARKHYTTATVLDDAYISGSFEALLDGGAVREAPPSPAAEEPPVQEPVSAPAAIETPVTVVSEAAPDPVPALEESHAVAETAVELEAEDPEASDPESPDVSEIASGRTLKLAPPVNGPIAVPVKGKKAKKSRVGRAKLATGAAAAAPVKVAAPAKAKAAPEADLQEATWSPKHLASRIKATQAMAKKKNRAFAVFSAGILHALIILLCLFWILKPGPLPEPSVIMSMKAPEDLNEQIEKKAIAQLLPQRPSSSSASRANVIAANTTSPLAVPIVEIKEVTDDILGAGDSFGMGSGWGDGAGGGGGGSVRFFGDEKQAKRVCYIVDFSYSMASNNIEGETRRDVLKRELIESIDNLSPSMRYTVIFFSGMPWLQDENPAAGQVISRQRMQDIALDVTWYDASKKNKQATVDRINGMALAGQRSGGGTIWMSGFEPAMRIKPKPDLVYLLTDGMCQDYISLPNAGFEEFLKEFISNTKAWEGFLGTMLELVPAGVSVNTIAMEVPGTVSERLAELAAKTGGDFSIVYEGKTYTGKRAQRFTDEKYDTPQ